MRFDLLYALRGFRNQPTFMVVAIASLALGIGLNAAMFNLVSAVLLQPLPVHQPGRLVSLYTQQRGNTAFSYCSYPNYKDFRDRNSVFSGLFLFSTIAATLAGDGDPEDLTAQLVTGNYFDVLGVRAFRGRTFLPEEDRVPGARPVVVISHALWTRRFAASPNAIGASLNLNNHPYTVIGVAPREFRGTNALVNTDLWVPFMMYQQIYPMADWVDHRKALIFLVAGRLKDGISRRQAEDNLKTLAAQLAREFPADNRDRTAALVPLTDSMIQPDWRGGFVLVGSLVLVISFVVLLIACANVANLLLVRAAGRRKEMVLRVALGVGRARLVRQLLTESAVLSLLGAIAALAVGRWARDLLWSFRPPWMLSGDSSLSLDGRVLAYTLLLAVTATIAFGLAPALGATRANLASELRERRSPWTRAGHRVHPRAILVMLQVALSVVALTGSGLFIRSLRYAQAVNPGFETARMATLTVDVKARGFNDAAGRVFYDRLLDGIRSLPGVSAASLASNPPFNVSRARSFSIDGLAPASGAATVALIDDVDPAYFQSLRIPVLGGRTFTGADSESTARVAVVNETMARRLWPGHSPIGRRLHFYGDPDPVQIVGVVRDSIYINIGEKPQFMVYLSLPQHFTPVVTLWVRTAGPPDAMLPGVRRAVHSLDRDVLLSDLQTVPRLVHESLWAPRLGAILFAGFGALAALLTILGVYGVISYSVGQRTREIGIRMALGARPRDVLRQVVAQGVILVFWGLVLGLLVTMTVAGVLKSLLFGVSTRDPLTLAVVCFLLLLTAVGACTAPALRAMRIQPMAALRDE